MQRHRSPIPAVPGGPGRRALLLLAGLLAAAGGSASSQEPSSETETSLEELAARATPAVVLIDAWTASGTRQGSGFLVDPNGRILTNYHVVRNARRARVKLASGDVYERVTVMATDERRDLAVIQIPGFDLPALELGNSDSVRIGAPVVLIGSPLGLENTVSTGIVSGRRQEPEGYQLLQISAPASQGSSGGAVLSAGGAVVGIAAAQMEGGQNLNFAVPINYARGLLSHLGEEPVAVLETATSSSPEGQARPTSSRDDAVNRGISLALGRMPGYVVESELRTGPDRVRQTRVTYRVIETVGGARPRLERYLESETTRRTEPFGTHQMLRKERSRTLVHLDGLQPVSARGETSWWTGESWKTAEYDLEFEGYRVRGLISDTTGRAEELDRRLPRGIILRELRELAFSALATDSLVGRSVELVTFDPATGQIVHDRYDVQGVTTVEATGEEHEAFRVNIASGLSNATGYFRKEQPSVLLRRVSADGTSVEEVTDLRLLGSGDGGG